MCGLTKLCSKFHILTERRSDSQFAMRTEGLRTTGHSEVLVEFNDKGLVGEAEQFLLFVSDCVMKSPTRLRSGETMRYGYWITKFEETAENTLETWEYNSSATEFIRGAALTLRFWKDQHALCDRFGAGFEPPKSDQLSVVSKGGFEGLPVQGVRYPSPDH